MILLQCAHGKHVELLEITRAHRAGIFSAWRIIECIGVHSLYRPDVHPGWNKFMFLADVLEVEADGAEVLYMDNDALALKSFRFQEALPKEYDIGGVMNVWSRINSGVLFIRNSPHVRNVIKRMLKVRSAAMADQDALHMFMPALKLKRLDAGWNQYNNTRGRSKDPFIKAWHGEGLEAAKRGIETIIHRAA